MSVGDGRGYGTTHGDGRGYGTDSGGMHDGAGWGEEDYEFFTRDEETHVGYDRAQSRDGSNGTGVGF